MKPIHTLSIEEATQELEQLLDAKPSEEHPLDLHHWNQAHGSRVAELQAWILMRPHQENPHPPTPKEPPMPAPRTPEQKLATLMARLERLLDQGDLRNAATARHEIRTLCREHNLPEPEAAHKLPPKGPTPAKPRPVQEKAAPKPVPPTAPAPIHPADFPPKGRTPADFESLKAEFLSVGRAVQGLAVLMVPWGNPHLAEKVTPEVVLAVAELMAILGEHIENTGAAVA
jgi:hypothetical protein